jgi:hypothetical protein
MSGLSFSEGERIGAGLGSGDRLAAGPSLVTTSVHSSREGAARRGTMAKGQKKSNKEIRKPKAEKPKKNASNPSTKGMVADLKR